MSSTIFISLLFVIIFTSLLAALFYLNKDKGKGKRMVRALTIRITLSILLFLGLLLASYFGYIHPN
jgi:hypothetical protein